MQYEGEVAGAWRRPGGCRAGRRCLAARFASDRNGLVLIEMSVVLLVLVTMLIGVTELSQALTLQRRVVTAAASAADLMTRATPAGSPLRSSDLADLSSVLGEIVGQDVKRGGEGGALGYRVTVLKISKQKAVVDDATVTYTCGATGFPTPRVPNDLINAVAPVDEVAEDGRIVVVQTRLKFTSSFTFFIRDAINLDGSSYFVPRLDSELKLLENQTC